MIKSIWPPRLLLWGLTGILLVGLTLAACGGATEPPPEPGTVPAQSEATSEVEAVAQDEPATVSAMPEKEAQESSADETAASPSDDAVTTAAECETVDIPDNTLIAAATETEWSKGPVDAPVTLIEYGDFQ